MNELTVIFFSCRRLHLLNQSIDAFIKYVTYPFVEFIIVNDSGDKNIHKELKRTYPGARFVLNERNVGLIQSIDNGYEQIETEYFLHFEDDWCVTKGGFVEQAMAIMESRADIEEVWFADYNQHPLDMPVYVTPGPLVTGYKLASENYQKGLNEINDFAWHGFTTACALKRMSDYNKVAPYADIPWQGTIWHREQAIGERYHQLGYRTACLMDEYVKNIGYGQSEYKTGMEK
jgi:GT2 family glycosyltransferase